MVCVLPFCNKDVHLLRLWLYWVRDLGGCKKHQVLLICDPEIDWKQFCQLRELAEQQFASVICSTIDLSIKDWIRGANALFFKSAQICQYDLKQPFLFCEPDAIPLKPDWLDILEKEYLDKNKSYLGSVLPVKDGSFYMNGVGIYPQNAYEKLAILNREGIPWDMACRFAIVPNAHKSDLIQHFWGQNDLPPIFVKNKKSNSPINSLPLTHISDNAVLFHRSKDGTLIHWLRRKQGFSKPLKIVYPFFNGDGLMALYNMEWIVNLNKYPFEVILVYEDGTNEDIVSRIEKEAIKSFVKVNKFKHKRVTDKFGPNIVFKESAKYMEQFTSPWLWMEFDAIPVKPNWIDVLYEKYLASNQLFYGPIVDHMGHMNGTGIYPPETSVIIHKTMQTDSTHGWDCIMKEEMIHLCADAMPYYYHCWGVQNGKLHPYLGYHPDFGVKKIFNQIPKEAVIVHRSKDGNLIKQLRSK